MRTIHISEGRRVLSKRLLGGIIMTADYASHVPALLTCHLMEDGNA